MRGEALGGKDGRGRILRSVKGGEWRQKRKVRVGMVLASCKSHENMLEEKE